MDKREPDTVPASAVPDSKKKGCGTSFLNNKRNEMDKLCGGTQATPEEYAQPDGEKENGGEG